MPIGASMAAAGKENIHWQWRRRRRRLRNCSRSSHMDGRREGQPRRIGRLISGAKMRRESRGESGDTTRAGRSKCGGDNRGRNYRAYRASGQPCAHSPLHNPSQRSPTKAAMPCAAHGGGGCDQVCGTINAESARSGVVWRLWPPAREGRTEEGRSQCTN